MKSRNGAETNKTQEVLGFKSNSDSLRKTKQQKKKELTSTASNVYGEISINHIGKNKCNYGLLH